MCASELTNNQIISVTMVHYTHMYMHNKLARNEHVILYKK